MLVIIAHIATPTNRRPNKARKNGPLHPLHLRVALEITVRTDEISWEVQEGGIGDVSFEFVDGQTGIGMGHFFRGD